MTQHRLSIWNIRAVLIKLGVNIHNFRIKEFYKATKLIIFNKRVALLSKINSPLFAKQQNNKKSAIPYLG